MPNQLYNYGVEALVYALVEFPLTNGANVALTRGYIVSVLDINKPNECELRTTTGTVWKVAMSYAATKERLSNDGFLVG